MRTRSHTYVVVQCLFKYSNQKISPTYTGLYKPGHKRWLESDPDISEPQNIKPSSHTEVRRASLLNDDLIPSDRHTDPRHQFAAK